MLRFLFKRALTAWDLTGLKEKSKWAHFKKKLYKPNSVVVVVVCS